MTEPCDLTAVEARAAISARQLSPVELTRSCLGRIDDLNPTLNAVVTVAAESGLEDARAADHARVLHQRLELAQRVRAGPVSYTHLPLPTMCSV